jgi:hypothetical protein
MSAAASPALLTGLAAHKALRDPKPFLVHLGPELERLQREPVHKIREEELDERQSYGGEL